MRIPFTNRVYDLYSFIQKKPKKLVESKWNIIAITGRQGTGKTYVAVREVFKNTPKDYKIITNIKSLNIPNRKIIYIPTLQEMINLGNIKGAVYLVDEMIKKYHKNSPIDLSFNSWLMQSRKNNRIFIFIYQDWKQCPTWLRESCNEIFITQAKLYFLNCTQVLDGTTLQLDDKSMQWTGETKGYIVYYRTNEICNMYDTLETINFL